MNWTENQIKQIIAELAEENTFACRALLKISEIKFTEKIETLCVSISSNPVLKINMSFLRKHAKTESEVKAVLFHEFLHVILQHTEKFTYNTPLLNIALDAIINSIIHRQYGFKYSRFFDNLYDKSGITNLLRPTKMFPGDDSEWHPIHDQIYSGKFAADDLYELLKYLSSKYTQISSVIFIGNHDFESQVPSDENKILLDEIISKMDGTGIWNDPGSRGANDKLNDDTAKILKFKTDKWRKKVFAILKKCLTADHLLKNKSEETVIIMPLLSNSDRRAMSLFSWMDIIPLTKNIITTHIEQETATIYLDVSGSMSQEINELVTLLYQFRKHIRMPLWVFSNDVEKASFENGNLVYKSTYGTSISCVFDHIRLNKIKKSIIVTDGFVESIDTVMLDGINRQKLWVIVSANGSASEFSKHKINYHQLKSIN